MRGLGQWSKLSMWLTGLAMPCHTDRSHALRGNAASDALRPLQNWNAERPLRHSHAERGNDQAAGSVRSDNLIQNQRAVMSRIGPRPLAKRPPATPIVPTLCVGMQPRTLCVRSELERGASLEAFPRGAWERSNGGMCWVRQPRSGSTCDSGPDSTPTTCETPSCHTDHSHALRGNAASDALRPLQSWNAERPLRHSHAERGNDQAADVLDQTTSFRISVR